MFGKYSIRLKSISAQSAGNHYAGAIWGKNTGKKEISKKEWDQISSELASLPAHVRRVELYKLLEQASEKIKEEIVSAIASAELELHSAPEETASPHIELSGASVVEASELEQLVANAPSEEQHSIYSTEQTVYASYSSYANKLEEEEEKDMTETHKLIKEGSVTYIASKKIADDIE